MVKRFATDARFEHPQTCLFELVILQYRMIGHYNYFMSIYRLYMQRIIIKLMINIYIYIYIYMCVL